jgi:uncharacterized membrane protein
MKHACVLLALIGLCGCGGGSMSTSAPMAVPAVKLPNLPTSWTATDLPPLPNANAAQANAVNAAGRAVGYSVNNGVAYATMWENGIPTELGPGVATAINDKDTTVGYRPGDGFMTVAVVWPGGDLGLLEGYDSTLATGISKKGVIVGVAYNSFDTSQQVAFKWTEKGGMQVVPGCQNALAINDKGQIAGIGTNFDAVICGGQDFGIQGAVGAINNSGLAVGFSPFGDNAHAFVFPSTDLGAQSTATGVNDYGWVIGDSFTPLGGAQARLSVRAHVARLFNPRLIGVSHPFVWSQKTGIVALEGIVTANGINGKRIVGATVTGDRFIHGVMLTEN